MKICQPELVNTGQGGPTGVCFMMAASIVNKYFETPKVWGEHEIKTGGKSELHSVKSLKTV